LAKKRRKKGLNKEMRSQIKGILLLALAVFCFVGLIHPDQVGGIGFYLNSILRLIAGDAAFILPIFIALIGLRFILPQGRWQLGTRLIGLIVFMAIIPVFIQLQLLADPLPAHDSIFYDSFVIGLNQQGGGVIGAALGAVLLYLLGPLGSMIILFTITFIAVLLIFNISIRRFLKLCSGFFKWLAAIIKKGGLFFLDLVKDISSTSREKIKEAAQNRSGEGSGDHLTVPEEHQLSIDNTTASTVVLNSDPTISEANNISSEKAPTETDQPDEQVKKDMTGGTKPEEGSTAAVTAGAPLKDYKFPPFELLAAGKQAGGQHHLKNSKDRARLLENTLQSFGVKAKVIHVQSGPTVTRFEVQPEAGVKVSKIISLSDDLALNLAAPLVRIEAPIPGKAALGIEVPNKDIALVNLREVMQDNAYRKSISTLTVALGKDITGIPVVTDLAKMPHLLIAGATGAGKSVCLNTLITSILYKADPGQVRFMMIDPKVVELSVYNGIPHLLMPVMTDPRKAALALRNMVREMGRRYDLFAKLEVRDIGAYNELSDSDPELEKLPFIVVIIDELADLMLVSPGEVEDSIARLAQMSRAAGIHLIIATQRPSVDVLTGIIKANITSRIAFTVTSQFDSRTILDMAGAEKLLGRGDMLFYPVGAVKPYRVQGAYVSEAEVKKVTDFIKEQGLVDYEEGSAFLETPEESEEEESDALFAEAVDLVVRTGSASISLLQRRFRIGYTRAARLIDDLERRGIVGPFEGSKPREVLVTSEQAAKICEDFNQTDAE